VRYYPLVVFALGAIAQIELRRHVLRELPALRGGLLLAPVLFALFTLFYPAFTSVVAVAGIALALRAARSRAPLRVRAAEFARGAAPYALACVAALPMIALFDLPAQSRSFFETFGKGDSGIVHQLGWAAYYLLRYEFLAPVLFGALALAGRALAAPARRRRAAARDGRVRPRAAARRRVDGVIARTPLFFSRYLVALSPLLSAACVIEVGCLLALRRTAAAARGDGGPGRDGDRRPRISAARLPELRGGSRAARAYRGPLDS
jgi:hypothetical protein